MLFRVTDVTNSCGVNNAGTRSLVPTIPPVDCSEELKALANAPTACPTGFNPRSLD